MVILDQLVEVATLNVFQLESYVARLVTYLLAGEALADVPTDTAPYAGPSVALLNSSYHLCDALVSHCVVCTEQNLVLVQLRHYDHARTFVQWALGGGVLNAKDMILVYEQEILFLAEVISCELTHVLGKHVVV